MQTTTTTEKSRIIDKPIDQITQQEKIEVGQAMINVFAYAGIFKRIDADKDQLWGEKEYSLICELIGHSYLTYDNKKNGCTTTTELHPNNT